MSEEDKIILTFKLPQPGEDFGPGVKLADDCKISYPKPGGLLMLNVSGEGRSFQVKGFVGSVDLEAGTVTVVYHPDNKEQYRTLVNYFPDNISLEPFVVDKRVEEGGPPSNIISDCWVAGATAQLRKVPDLTLHIPQPLVVEKPPHPRGRLVINLSAEMLTAMLRLPKGYQITAIRAYDDFGGDTIGLRVESDNIPWSPPPDRLMQPRLFPEVMINNEIIDGRAYQTYFIAQDWFDKAVKDLWPDKREGEGK